MQAKVAENVGRQHSLLNDIQKNQAAYRQAFGYDQWKQACDVRPPLLLPHVVPVKPTGHPDLRRGFGKIDFRFFGQMCSCSCNAPTGTGRLGSHQLCSTNLVGPTVPL